MYEGLYGDPTEADRVRMAFTQLERALANMQSRNQAARQSGVNSFGAIRRNSAQYIGGGTRTRPIQPSLSGADLARYRELLSQGQALFYELGRGGIRPQEESGNNTSGETVALDPGVPPLEEQEAARIAAGGGSQGLAVHPGGMAVGAALSAGVGALIGHFVPFIGTKLGALGGAALSFGGAAATNYKNYGEVFVTRDEYEAAMAGLGKLRRSRIPAGNIMIRNQHAEPVVVRLINHHGRVLGTVRVPAGVTRQVRIPRAASASVTVSYRVGSGAWVDEGGTYRLSTGRSHQTIVLGSSGRSPFGRR